MATHGLITDVRARWEGWAGVPVSFPATGEVNVVVAPDSGLCPPGWVGVVTLEGAGIATAPSRPSAAAVRAALDTLPVGARPAPDAVRGALPVAEVLGPAALAYVSAEGFRPRAAPARVPVERLPARHADLARLAELASREEVGEASLDGITSPAFAVRDGGRVVAAAGYERWPGGVAHVCVLTGARWRGRGLARTTASAAVAHALAAGLVPQWRARVPASRSVAAALGFRELGTQVSLLLADAPGTGAGRG
ncbi:Protein N-acetyltransferase, RimJ/RimL family [Streptomyces zhaozhouensis]|uniref:Protein N-acetyltransferase, RimJ/RimL family n=1 Tax=Streptomyces zhaozhouensis TaxID=1300267 RepID=A0A286DZM8_9ACTN|nr:GNAT family N-acetyltransferase [Streptomyces zhaozhouensis]SOD64117.1 Protein N-acetyltransferase, RimJ/RimL family [Streptomyces zhaozhouensis]